MLHGQILTSCGTLLTVFGHRLRRSAADGGVEELRQYLEEEITCPDDPQDPNPTQPPTALPIDGRYARKDHFNSGKKATPFVLKIYMK